MLDATGVGLTPAGYNRREWQAARTVALERARHRCGRCFRKPPDVVLVVHHIDEQGIVGKRATEQTNLRVLCRGCHQLEHGRWPPTPD